MFKQANRGNFNHKKNGHNDHNQRNNFDRFPRKSNSQGGNSRFSSNRQMNNRFNKRPVVNHVDANRVEADFPDLI